MRQKSILLKSGTEEAARRLRQAVASGKLRGHLVRPEPVGPVEPAAPTATQEVTPVRASSPLPRRRSLSGAQRWGALASGAPECQRVKRLNSLIFKEVAEGAGKGQASNAVQECLESVINHMDS